MADALDWTLQTAPADYLERWPDGPNADLARAILAEGQEPVRVRFVRYSHVGRVISPGEELELPAEVAQRRIDEGEAIRL